MSMRTMADHLLDIAQNAINAGATSVRLTVEETPRTFRFLVIDNGKGMDPATVERVFDPFYTTREKKIRRFGLGLPFLREAARMTGGDVRLQSEKGKGTEIEVLFRTDHIDCQPVGDLGSVWFSLLSYSPDIRWRILRRYGEEEYEIDSVIFTQMTRSSEDFYAPAFLQLMKESLQELEESIREKG